MAPRATHRSSLIRHGGLAALTGLALLLQACASKPPAPTPAPAPQPPAPEAPAIDSRLIVDAQEYPWSAIGRLNLAGQGFCNGIMIGPQHVLTQARCLYDGRGQRWFLARELHFIAAYQKDSYLADSAVGSFTTAPGFNPAGGVTLANLANNWAVVTLAKPIGNQVGWLSVTWDGRELQSAAARGEAVSLRAGYRQNWPHAISLFYGCAEGVADPAGLCHPTPMEQSLTPFVLNGTEMTVLGDFYFRSAADSAPAAQAAALRISGDRLGRAAAPAGAGPVRRVPEVTVQLLLQGLGYDVESAGLSGAVTAFQRDRGLPARGAADLDLLRDLIAAAQGTR
jgi:hypothetical protein